MVLRLRSRTEFALPNVHRHCDAGRSVRGILLVDDRSPKEGRWDFGTIGNPFFGTVKQKRESWETSMTVPDLGSDLRYQATKAMSPQRINKTP